MDQLPLLFILLFLSSFFSAAEIALFSLGAEKITALKNQTEKDSELQRIKRLEVLKTDPQKLLVTILLAVNIVNIASSALATLITTKFAESHGFKDQEALVIGLVTGILTFFTLVFVEIIPKSFGHRHNVRVSLFSAPIISVLQFIFAPIIIPLSKMVKTFSGNHETPHGLTEDEIKAALELSEREGKIDRDEKNWAEKILEFGEHTVENVMTPHSKIFALADDLPIPKALQKIQEEKFSRIPIYHEVPSQITGILSVHGLVEKISEPNFSELKLANLPLKKPYKIPITMKIDTLLHAFQREKTHLALVYDEHGGLTGLITLEDVLEEIFGEIHDEEDDEKIEVHQIGKSLFLCGAETELEQLENFVRIRMGKNCPTRFPWKLEDENKTLGLFILEQFEKFPEKGEKIELSTRNQKFYFRIKNSKEDKILEVEFGIIPQAKNN